MDTTKPLSTRYIYSAFVAAIFIAQTADAQGIGSLGYVLEMAESVIRSQVRNIPPQVPTTLQGNSNQPTDRQHEAKKAPTIPENNTEIAETQNNSNRKASTLDNLMGSDQPNQSNTTSAITKASFFAEFERDYLEKSDDTGHLPAMRQKHDKVANSIAVVLPAEFGVSASCVQQLRTDGSISGSMQAMTIAAAMYDVLDQLVPTANKGGMLRDRVNSLSQPGMGCTKDFLAIKQFLSEYSDFAKGMLGRKLALVAERNTKEQEKARQAKIAADQRADEKANKEREAQAREAEMRKQKKEADEKRRIALRSGAEKPASFKDYMLMHDHGTGDQFYGSPLLKADSKVYLFGTGALDREEDGGLLVKSPVGGYIYVRTNRNTPIYGDLRINIPIVVIGRYVENIQYTTIIGAVKTAPVIEAIAISKAPVYY